VLRADGSLDYPAFAALWPDLRVIGRCSPKDKFTIVQGASRPAARPALQAARGAGVPW